MIPIRSSPMMLTEEVVSIDQVPPDETVLLTTFVVEFLNDEKWTMLTSIFFEAGPTPETTSVTRLTRTLSFGMVTVRVSPFVSAETFIPGTKLSSKQTYVLPARSNWLEVFSTTEPPEVSWLTVTGRVAGPVRYTQSRWS